MPNFSGDSVSWCLNHLASYHDTDIFPMAFEYQALMQNETEVINFFSSRDICQWDTRPYRKLLVPKQRLGFRSATQLDPLDMIAFFSLVLDISEDLEALRIPVEENVVFSNRLSIDENHLFFNRDVGYSNFQTYSNECAEEFNYVLVTDIADFFPRIYHHRLENSLSPVMNNFPSHVTAIIKLIKGWNQKVSYGIPIGNNPSRILAEILIGDIDKLLMAKHYKFCRFVDDYRFFCNSKKDAYRALVDLATCLYDTHGLTLNEQKTKIMTSEEFCDQVLFSEERREISSLSENFSDILRALGMFDPYETIDYDDLPDEIQDQIDKLNLLKILEDELSKEEFDLSITKFCINRLGWSRNTDAIQVLLDKFDILSPVFNEFIRYLARIIDDISNQQRKEIGAQFFERMESSPTCQLDYNRMLIFGLFAGSNKWGNTESLIEFYDKTNNEWLRRCLLLAFGEIKADYYLRTRKVHIDSMSHWERRAFLFSFKFFPRDERDIFYKTRLSGSDFLDQIVIRYSKSVM